MQPIITRIDLFRHGETEGGAYYRGSTDDALTANGWQQMRTAVTNCNDWQTIISSPLSRCLAFAKEFSQQTDIPLLIEPHFQEIHFGDWEGKKAEQISAAALTRFYQQPSLYPPPNGENWTAFQQRIASAWQQVLKNQRGKTVLIITHAGVIRTLFCWLLKIPVANSFAIQVEHASLTRFSCYHSELDDYMQLNFHNRLIL
jgi:broad specificity phosphatase PhoE